MKKFLLFLSLLSVYFTNAQSITITQPNGGEVLASCQVYPVKWTQTGSPSNYWNIDYSLDGGTIWTSVASNFLSTNGQFNWTVPNVQSNTVLMRVYDALNASTVDQSNAFFTINIPIVLTSPNGGEVWQGATVQNITWNALGTSNTYNIAYSTNGGTSWTNIVTNYANSTGVYAWTVPNIPSNNCLVRVQDYVQNCMQDISASVFTITPAQPILLTPNGGETIQQNCGYNITWNTATFFSNVRLEYSLNNGSTWTTIITSTSNNGSYYWYAPITPSTLCLIRASNTSSLSVNDVSNATFTIPAGITVTSPNGGETRYGCSIYNITWNHSDCANRFNLEYSIDGGSTWSYIITNYSAGYTLMGSYSWQVPNGISSSQCRIRVSDYNSVLPSDISDANFTISPSNDITVTAPNGGESLVGLSTYTINWSNLPSASGQYSIQYSTNNGGSWTTIASNVTGNAYVWTVPNIPSTQCLIKVIDYANTCKFDVSDNTFTITPAQPILLTPNGGETIQQNCGYNITWNTATFFSNVRLEYSLNNGSTWTTIITSTSNNGSYYWYAPITPSTLCLIRASNTSSLSVNDVSNATFTIPAGITVTSPNGGETRYGCSIYNITWNHSDCANRFNLEYSIDGGSTWSYIITNYSAGYTLMGSYSWQVPNGISSSQCRIRVSDYNSVLPSDMSDANFTIAPSNDITVTAPNGGESLVGLSTYTINWSNLPSASGQYSIQYSTNNGGSWTTIASNVTGNAYVWTVPNIPSTQCLIKVIDYANTCKFDVSDNTFTITPAQPILLTPNGGETIQQNCGYNITWNTATFFSNVRLEYSLNNGSTWTTIITSTSNNGSYYWYAPITPSTLCLIRASNTSSLSVNDVSNATFTIPAGITVTSPNGGETRYGCSMYNITWSHSDCANRFNLEYSIDGGSTWSYIITNYSAGYTLMGSYSWQVPNGISSSQCRIRVSDYNSVLPSDISDANFTIAPSNDITVTAPNGGESLVGLSTYTINWSNLPSASGQYSIQYSTNNGGSWTTIASNVTGNAYVWTVPNIPSTQCLIKVIDYANTCKFDVSDNTFTITPAQPILLTPNGGETIQQNCGYNITWNTATFFSNVRLEYSLNNGSTWTTIITSTSNNGSYYWYAPITPSTLCLIRASNTSSLSVNDVSNATFTIPAGITVTSPNGGETRYGCSMYNITWNHSDCANRFNLEYSIDGGSTWSYIITNYSAGYTLVGSYSWQVPNGISSSQCRIRVSDYNSVLPSDISDANFTIAPSNDITVTAPNGGESLVGLSTYTINWSNLPSASGQYSIQYSTNNGGSWTTIASNVTGNAYVWTVPNIPSTQCLIKVIDYANTCKFDVSDNTFTITPAQPILLTPNGGETIQQNCGYNITWNTATFFSNVRLEYSLNNGSTWTTIITSTSNNGSYYWYAPITPSTLCLIRASNTSSLSVNDVSNATFTIPAGITVTSPNGGETRYGCSMYNITWNHSDCANRFNLEYSIDGGSTWSYIITNYSAGYTLVGSYSWQVPNGISSSQCGIRVSDYNSVLPSDISDANFTIAPSNDITVTAPNGGESLVGLSTYTINWSNLPSASGQYSIQYSTNNGSSWTTIASNVTGNAYVWTVPNIPSTQCLIKVIDYANTCKFDVSDNTFTITPAQPILISPNGGEILYSGMSHNITWNSATFFSNVRLEYSIDNGATWTTIITSTSNNGSYYWTIPNASSTQCLVRASNTSSLSVNDVSNATFTIKPAVTIITPNGNNGVTIWGGCTVTSITFDRSPAWNNYYIEYSINNGATWSTVVTNWVTSANPATYNWSMPNTPSSQVRVRVTPTSATTYGDQSDNVFTITKPVTIIQPNFGGVMQSGTVYPIKWTSDGISNIYDIFYSTNGGTSYTNIVMGYNTSINTYSWTVPAIVSNNCKIIVRDNINTCKTDTSDQAFIIQATPPAITLLNPNGGDSLKGCSTYTINWTDAIPTGTYNLHYSINSGSTWNTIASNYVTSTDNYNWIVPNTINSGNVLIRVQSASTLTVLDLSDALLTIVNGTLTATPASTAICSGTAVQFNASGGVNYTWSPATDLSASNISNPIATPAVSTIYTVQSVNGSCVLSNTVNVTVSGSGAPASVSITASPSNSVCPGTTIIFSANPVNGGVNPAYQWILNGATTGVTSTTYTNNTLTTGDVVECLMTSGLPCVSSNPALSNGITINTSSGQTPAVTVIASPSNTICPGTLVTFTANPSFGGPAPSYVWKLNGTTVSTNSTYTTTTLTNNSTVSVIMTSNAGCVTSTTASSVPMIITVNATPAVPSAISGSTVVCANGAYTYTTAAVSGATTYNWTLPSGWSGTSTSNTIAASSGATGGVISVQAANACGTSASRILSVSIGAPGISISGPTSVCFGSSATFTAGGSAMSFTWSTAQTGSVIAVSPTVTSTYTVTGADAGGCQNTAVKTITVVALPTVAASSPTICGGTTATITASGASTYTWNTGATGANLVVTPASTTNYTVTGTSAAGCVNTKTTSVTVTPGPVLTISNATICAGTPTVLTASGVTTYTWNTGATTSTLSVSPSSTTAYTVSGGNPGCASMATKVVTVTVNANPTTGISGTASFCSGQSTVLTATGTATSYTWSTGETTASISVSPTANTTYSVSGANANGCTTTAVRTITVNALPSVAATSPTICGGSSATVTASGASTYTWNTGAIGANLVVTPSSTTNYTVTGTSTAGCVNTATSSVTVGATPSIAVNAATVCAGTSATLTASGVSTYTWNTGATGSSIIVTPASTTVYTVSGNLTGCSTTAIKTTTVTVNALPAMNITAGNTSICKGQSTTLTLTGSATSYTWNTGQITSGISVSPTVTTTYSVNGLNANGCSTMAMITVTVNALPTVSASTASVCLGGTVTISASGASTYTWNTGATGANLNVSPGTATNYTVTGTSVTGCVNSATTQVTVGPAPSITVNSATVCAGTAATLTANGATSYTWSTTTPGPSLVVSPVSTTIFTVSGSSAGCNVVAMNTATVTVNTAPTMNISGNTSLCAGQSTTLTVATSAATYTWNTGQTSSTIAVAPGSTTVYNVNGQSSNGCSATASATVSVNAIPTIGVNNATICAGGSTTLTANGGVAYTWNTGAIGANTVVSPTVTTSYTVTGMGTGGCMNTAVSSVVVTASPSISVNSGTICSGNAITLTASGASTYTWNTGQQTPTISVSPGSSTVYTVTGEIAGCNVYPSQTAIVVVNITPNVTAVSSRTLICSGETATLTAIGATTYSWNSAQTGSVVVVNPTTNTSYTVSGLSPEGCKDEAVLSVSVSPCTGVAENASKNINIDLYPNPFTGVFTIRYAEQDNDEVTVLNALGAIVYQTRLTEEKTEIALPYEAGGIYFVQIKTRYGVVTQKIVKE